MSSDDPMLSLDAENLRAANEETAPFYNKVGGLWAACASCSCRPDLCYFTVVKMLLEFLICSPSRGPGPC